MLNVFLFRRRGIRYVNRNRFFVWLLVMNLGYMHPGLVTHAAWAGDKPPGDPDGPPGKNGGGPPPSASGPPPPPSEGRTPHAGGFAPDPVPLAEQERSLGQNEALFARNQGEIISLREALEVTRSEKPGKIIEVKLFRRGDSATYRIKIKDAEGYVHSLRIDARTGDILGLFGIAKRRSN